MEAQSASVREISAGAADLASLAASLQEALGHFVLDRTVEVESPRSGRARTAA